MNKDNKDNKDRVISLRLNSFDQQLLAEAKSLAKELSYADVCDSVVLLSALSCYVVNLRCDLKFLNENGCRSGWVEYSSSVNQEVLENK